jgi:lysyl-tRNA synthetase class 2
MELKRVSSSALEAVGYDPERGLLRVVVTGGKAYDYYHVPESVYQGLMKAASKGTFYTAHIRGRYG